MKDIRGLLTLCSKAIFVLPKLRIMSMANCKGEQPIFTTHSESGAMVSILYICYHIIFANILITTFFSFSIHGFFSLFSDTLNAS